MSQVATMRAQRPVTGPVAAARSPRPGPSAGAEVTWAAARAPGTCGELVQGVLNGHDFLITCPIDLYSRVTVTLCEGNRVRAVRSRRVNKTLTAVERFMRARGYDGGAEIQVESNLPQGKGLASSSADITAGVHAAAEALGLDVAPYELGRIAIGLEPSDAVFYRGITIFDQIKGVVLEPLGAPPPIRLFIVDAGGTLDTDAFDRDLHRRVARKHEKLLVRAVNLVRQGLRNGDPALVGEGATLSTEYHQEVRENPLVHPALEISRRTGGVGVNVAHSGTVVGLMYDARRCDEAEVLAALSEMVGAERLLGVCNLVGGGSSIEKRVSAGITEAQQRFIEVFGEPLHRLPHDRGCALEFAHPTREDTRFYAFPDGTLHVDCPDPSEGMAPASAWRRPAPGERWEMRVRALDDGAGPEVRYLPLPSHPVTDGVVRSLARDLFVASFERDGDQWVRRVEIARCANSAVTYRAVGRADGAEGTNTLRLPIFLANYRPEGDAR